jgi:hypothetical protein
MITFKVLHHTPGRIRIKVTSLKGLSIETLKRLSSVPIPAGIIEISPNPLTGNLIIKYDPESIDIMKYLEEVASNREIQNIIGYASKPQR